MARFSVVLDACVLYPAPLRDLLMRLALKNPEMSIDDFLAVLQKQQLPQTVSKLREYLEFL